MIQVLLSLLPKEVIKGGRKRLSTAKNNCGWLPDIVLKTKLVTSVTWMISGSTVCKNIKGRFRNWCNMLALSTTANDLLYWGFIPHY